MTATATATPPHTATTATTATIRHGRPLPTLVRQEKSGAGNAGAMRDRNPSATGPQGRDVTWRHSAETPHITSLTCIVSRRQFTRPKLHPITSFGLENRQRISYQNEHGTLARMTINSYPGRIEPQTDKVPETGQIFLVRTSRAFPTPPTIIETDLVTTQTTGWAGALSASVSKPLPLDISASVTEPLQLVPVPTLSPSAASTPTARLASMSSARRRT